MSLTQNMENSLNEQLNFEIESAHIYLAMAGYASTLGLDGFVNFFEVQYEEELFHAKKLMHYIIDRNGKVTIKGFQDPQNKFDSLMQAFEYSLEHEKEVSQRINNIAALANNENDFATRQFLDWYINEQVEEESSFQSIIDQLNLVADGSGLYLLDKEMSARAFNAPAL